MGPMNNATMCYPISKAQLGPSIPEFEVGLDSSSEKFTQFVSNQPFYEAMAPSILMLLGWPCHVITMGPMINATMCYPKSKAQLGPSMPDFEVGLDSSSSEKFTQFVSNQPFYEAMAPILMLLGHVM